MLYFYLCFEQSDFEMKVLVTGGAGFIGSNLCEALLERNYEVVCLDNLLTGHKKNISHLLENRKFKFIFGDICDKNICLQALQGCEKIIHLAALGSVPRSINDPIATNKINIDGFLNVIDAAKELKIKRFVFAASSSTYGDSIELPKVEARIGMPLSPYAVTKYVNELYAHVYALNYQLDFIGLRYFNVFGKNQDPNGAYAAVIPKFIQNFLNLESPLINGDGTNTRDFTHVENVVHATILALETGKAEVINQVYNVAFGKSTTIIELAQCIKNEIRKKKPDLDLKEIEFGPYREGDIPHSKASTEKIESFLGYQPKVSVEEGIKKTINWFLD